MEQEVLAVFQTWYTRERIKIKFESSLDADADELAETGS